jgi:hypothetical protein
MTGWRIRSEVRTRSSRKLLVRARSISMRRMTRREIALTHRLVELEGPRQPLPKTRGECANSVRPCPFVSCKHHLYLDVSPRTGSLKLNFPDREPDGMVESCVLDVTDRGEATLEETGDALNMTRERVRQIEESAIRKLGKHRHLLPLLREVA